MGGSSKAPTTTQTQSYQMSPEERQLFNLTMPYLTEYASTPIQQFGGSGVVPLNALEQQAQQQYLTQAAPTAQGLATGAAGTQAKLLDPNFMLNPNQYVQAAGQAVTDTATQNLMEKILPGIRSGAEAAGGPYSGGSTREGVATGKAIGDTGRGISDALANMYFSNYTSGLSGLSQAIERNPSVMSSQLFPADITAAVGGQQRAEQQARLDEQIKQFYTQQDLPLLQGQQLMQLMGAMRGYGTTTGTATGSVPQSNPLMQALGLGMGAAGMAMGGPIGGAVGGGLSSALTGGK